MSINVLNISSILVLTLLLMAGSASASWAAKYYVATTGNDNNAGTLSSPFHTVQRGISSVKAGDTLLIRAGTYHEALTLENSGAKSKPITVRNYAGETATIDSGELRAIVLSRTIGYYTFEGLTFVSQCPERPYSGDKNYSLDFGISTSWWGWGAPVDDATTNSGGNNGFTLKKCNITGSVGFMGSYNTVTNCVLDGGSQIKGRPGFTDGIHDVTIVSHHNTYTNNIIHDYVNRGIWTMSNTSYITIRGNTIYNFAKQNKPDGLGIDLDGAYISNHHCLVEFNTVYNGFCGIEFENGNNNIANGNTIHECERSICLISYGPPTACREYRTSDTNAIIMNNLVYNSTTVGIVVVNSPGNRIYNNTVDHTRGWAGIFLADGGKDSFQSNNCTIRNNIVSNSASGAYALQLQGSITGTTLKNNLYFNSGISSSTHNWDRHGVRASAGWDGQGAHTLTMIQSVSGGMESGSIYANPEYVSGGYSLRSTSPAINAGAAISVVTADILGTPRPQGGANDIGAYEYVAAPASSKGHLPIHPGKALLNSSK